MGENGFTFAAKLDRLVHYLHQVFLRNANNFLMIILIFP